MDFHDEDFDEKDEIQEVVLRFERMINTKSRSYFEVDEFEQLIDWYLFKHDTEKALKATECGLLQYPNSSEIKLKKVQALIEKGSFNDALDVLNEIEFLESGNYIFYILRGASFVFLGKMDDAIKNFDLAIENAEPDEKIDVIIDIAANLNSTGELNYSEDYLLRAYKLDSENASVMLELANLYERLGNFPKSISFFRKYLDEEPYDIDAWFSLGLVFKLSKKDNDAIDAFEFVIAINKRNFSAYYNIAEIHLLNGNYTKAIETYQDFIDIDSTDPLPYYYMGECYEEARDFDNALNYYNKTLEIDSMYADAFLGMAVINLELKKFDISLINIEKALNLDADNPEYWYTKGMIYSAMNETENAIEAFEKALEFEVFDVELWLDYSDEYYKKKQYNKAIEILNNALMYHAKEADVYYTLALYYFSDKEEDIGFVKLKEGLNLDIEKYSDYLELFSEFEIFPKIEELFEKYKNK